MLRKRHLAGDGEFTRKCHAWLESNTGSAKALLTHSCTAALEMAAILANVGPGDEVIMPSYTFVSTANAFVLRGATPVFVDIRPDTLNLDERKVEGAITKRTRAIAAVHYAGVACEMEALSALAERHGLRLVEDAAQALGSTYKGRPLGALGHLGCLSFHETKNIVSGEGGALLVNDPEIALRAEIVREKGTNRTQFFRGQADKYTWMDLGSSYLPSDILAAVLWAQLEQADAIRAARLQAWNAYQEALETLESEGLLRRPQVPPECGHNANLYYILLPSETPRDGFIRALRDRGVNTVFHYVPLHSSPGGRRFGRTASALPVTESIAGRLVRLPLWVGVDTGKVVTAVEAVARSSKAG
ncbi:MAG TPA: dTDP-4-amino-4,6-dideoxygalactose transaminase [Burkholderiales bacterium]|nr:dTDP-4-amino-4,6-dideoxygalactose transaminase [Burkholderiales bacterium]